MVGTRVIGVLKMKTGESKELPEGLIGLSRILNRLLM